MRLAVIDSSNPGLDAGLGYDGHEIILEALSNNRTRRYVHGPGTDEPLVAYLVTSTGTSRSWYSADERGSTLRQSNDSGTPTGAIGRYDEYGVGPGTSRFQYTGQYWLGDKNLHYYRARVYDARLGRFLQPDPIGYGDGMNLYAYVGGDPVNFTDPLGLDAEGDCGGKEQAACEDIVVIGSSFGVRGGGGGGRGNSGSGSMQIIPNEDVDGDGQPDPDIVVTGTKETVVTSSEGAVAPSIRNASAVMTRAFPARGWLVMAGGPGFDSGLPRDAETLEKMLEDAKRAKDTALARRIIRQQKMIDARNKGKERGGGKFRIINPLFIIIPVLQQQMHEFNCRMSIDDGIPCNIY